MSEKLAQPFLEQDRSAKVKAIYRALVREHPEMPAEMKARIAARRGKPSARERKSPRHGGPPYKGPLVRPDAGGGHKTASVEEAERTMRETAARPVPSAALYSALGAAFLGGATAGLRAATMTARGQFRGRTSDALRHAVLPAALGGLTGFVSAKARAHEIREAQRFLDGGRRDMQGAAKAYAEQQEKTRTQRRAAATVTRKVLGVPEYVTERVLREGRQ